MDIRPTLPFYIATAKAGKYNQPSQNPLINIARFFTCSGHGRGRCEKLFAFIGLTVFMFIFYCCLLYMSGDENLNNSDAKIAVNGGRMGGDSGLGDRLKALRNIIDGKDNIMSKQTPHIGGYNKNLLKHDAHDQLDREDPHLAHDRAKFRKKVDKDDAQIPKPKSGQEIEKLQADMAGEHSVDLEQENEFRRNMIKNMTIFAWDNYRKYAWGANELKPISKTAHHSSVFGSSLLGATLIDGLDTLYIMGLLDRFDEGRKWVEMSFNFKEARGDLSVFETNIRFVGGLLSCYALTKDELFKQKAEEVAKLLLPAFDTPTGIPYALINVQSGSAKNYGWASAGSSILSEFGTLNIEFDYLSIVTGNPKYSEKVKKVREMLNAIDKIDGFYMNYLNPKTGKWGSRHVSMGALGDSFYEYLLKSWLITNKRDVEGLKMYEEALQAFEKKLFFKSQKDGLFYIAEMKGSRIDHKFDHLACFASGMFALHAVNVQNDTAKKHWLEKAEELAHTCHESYIRAGTHLGPESFRFTNEFSAMTINDREKYFILRPEVVEAWFYLWRLTKNQKYRDWAWDAALSIEKYCKTEAGYSGIRNVYEPENVSQDDVQQSFFLAETLKYFYLIFSPDDVIPLDKWVFNTEAHPLPVRFADSDHAPNGPNSNINDNRIKKN
uniref:alpha-1,2-Mannosidase n=1 Tax=Romanomermis culicivorax TaxID=13658 RepID=A0A915JZP7_ROMCU